MHVCMWVCMCARVSMHMCKYVCAGLCALARKCSAFFYIHAGVFCYLLNTFTVLKRDQVLMFVSNIYPKPFIMERGCLGGVPVPSHRPFCKSSLPVWECPPPPCSDAGPMAKSGLELAKALQAAAAAPSTPHSSPTPVSGVFTSQKLECPLLLS